MDKARFCQGMLLGYAWRLIDPERDAAGRIPEHFPEVTDAIVAAFTPKPILRLLELAFQREFTPGEAAEWIGARGIEHPESRLDDRDLAAGIVAGIHMALAMAAEHATVLRNLEEGMGKAGHS